MMRLAAVTTTRIPLSGEQWIEVKDELSRGDRLRMRALGLTRGEDGNWYADPEKIPNAKPLTYIVAWSFGDVISAEALNALTEDTGAEIEAAVAAHDEAHAKKSPSPAGAKQ